MTDVLAGYSAAGPGHDEMLQSTGAAREAWAQMADLAGLADGSQLAARAREVVDLLEDNGVRFGAGRAAAPWRLDPLPVLFDELEWARVEAGLQQRALLLDHILTDISGDSRLLTSGLIPPSLVLAHPGLLREVADIRNPGPHQLVMLGTDIARNADGSWQVLADRAQVPMGMGYAMQDRRIVAEVLSGLYRHSRIRRVGPFFQAMRAAVHGAAPSTPRVPRAPCCSARGRSPRPPSTRPMSPRCSDTPWWRAPTSWWRTAGCGCAPGPVGAGGRGAAPRGGRVL